MKTPDYGQGISDFKSKIMQLLALYFGAKGAAGGTPTSILGQTAMPAPKPMGGMEMFAGQGANATMGGQGQQGFNLTPEMIQKIIALLNARGGQFGQQRY